MGLDPAGQREMGWGCDSSRAAPVPCTPQCPTSTEGSVLCNTPSPTGPPPRGADPAPSPWEGAGLHLQDPALAPGEVPQEPARLPDGSVGRRGWRKASSLLSAGEELIILFSHYTGIKSILEQHKFRCLKSLFLTSRETFLSLSCPFPNHFSLIAQPSTFQMKHKMEGH